MSPKRFYLGLAALSLALLGLVPFVLTFRQPPGPLWVYLGAVALPALLSALGFRLLHAGLRGGQYRFQSSLSASMIVRMLLSIAYILGVNHLFAVNVYLLVGVYFAAYFSGTAFEVWALLNNLRRQTDEATPPDS